MYENTKYRLYVMLYKPIVSIYTCFIMLSRAVSSLSACVRLPAVRHRERSGSIAVLRALLILPISMAWKPFEGRILAQNRIKWLKIVFFHPDRPLSQHVSLLTRFPRRLTSSLDVATVPSPFGGTRLQVLKAPATQKLFLHCFVEYLE